MQLVFNLLCHGIHLLWVPLQPEYFPMGICELIKAPLIGIEINNSVLASWICALMRATQTRNRCFSIGSLDISSAHLFASFLAMKNCRPKYISRPENWLQNSYGADSPLSIAASCCRQSISWAAYIVMLHTLSWVTDGTSNVVPLGVAKAARLHWVSWNLWRTSHATPH